MASAVVKAGRVVEVDIKTLRHVSDMRARRALISAIDSALRDTYRCPGDHVFSQEFLFRVE